MRILYLCSAKNIQRNKLDYAPNIHIHNTVKHLRKLGHDVYVLLPRERGSFAHHVRSRNISHRAKKFLPRFLTSTVRNIDDLIADRKHLGTLGDICKHFKPDFIYERFVNNYQAGVKIAKQLNIPIILEMNAPVEESKQLWGGVVFPLSKRIERAVLQQVTGMIVVSSVLREYYLTRHVGCIARDNIFLIPNGVDAGLFNPNNIRRDVRKELGISEKIVIGFIGNLRVYHGIELLPSLCQKLVCVHKNLHFLVVGEGQNKTLLLQQIQARNLKRYFSLVSSIPHWEAPAYIAAMDICILPNSNWYGSPMKIFEYGAMGKPIVAPKLGPILDVLQDNHTACLFHPYSVRELTSKTSNLIDNPVKREQLGINVRKHMLEHHTWLKNAQRILDAYHSLGFGPKSEQTIRKVQVTANENPDCT